jgi:hypothetical protein
MAFSQLLGARLSEKVSFFEPKEIIKHRIWQFKIGLLNLTSISWL